MMSDLKPNEKTFEHKNVEVAEISFYLAHCGNECNKYQVQYMIN